ncbi:NAD-dependent epimerase/dehydratase family protein [Microbulbifer agarilyticus]
MKVGIIGHTGFVGSNLLQQLEKECEDVHKFNSKNIETIVGQSFDELYVSAIQAKKWWANQNEQLDLDLIVRLVDQLRFVSAKRVIFISTVDVYDPPVGATESTAIEKVGHAYGKNRLIAEQLMMEIFPCIHIVRLQGLVGKNLSKNIIYDLKMRNRLEHIPLDSSFQWYPLEMLYSHIKIIIENNLSLVNLSVEPISTQDVVGLADLSDPELDLVGTENAAQIEYNVTSMYSENFESAATGYVVSRERSISAIKNYFTQG